MAALSHDQLKTLEQTRLRLLQLSQSIASLIDSIERSDPLPEWSSLQSRAAIISNNLSALSHQLADNSSLLSSLQAYPTPDYPGRTEAGILSQLMRTKLEPYAEDWIEQGRKLGTEGSNASENHTVDQWSHNAQASSALSAKDLKALWRWAPIEANRLARQRKWGGNYTLEEEAAGVENVVTGLRNRHDEDEDEDESESDEEEEEEERGEPMLPIEEVLKFMMTGAPPKSRVTPASGT